MNFDLTDDQKMLQEQARRYLSDHVDYDRLRGLLTQDAPMDRDLWTSICEMGWPAVALPEQYGGLGLGVLEQCVLTQELGRVVAPLPYSSSLGLAAETIVRCGTEAQKQAYLPGLASGETIAALAIFEGAGDLVLPGAEHLATSVTNDRITGDKWPVLDAGVADLLLVAARTTVDRYDVYLVDPDHAGVSIERVAGFDQLKQGFKIRFHGVPCERLGVGDFHQALPGLFDRAAVLTAFEQIGGAEACLYMARDYSLVRRAFGRQIGSFQAVKHKLADMLTKIELARSNAYYAGWALANDTADQGLAAATARLSATEAYEFAARENMQVHGGISFTWEANCHFHYRRSRLLALELGSSRFWSDRIVENLVAAQEI